MKGTYSSDFPGAPLPERQEQVLPAAAICSIQTVPPAIQQTTDNSWVNASSSMPNLNPNLHTAAKYFDNWMNEYEESHRKTGTWFDHNQALMAYLSGPHGFRYIKTYEEFCQLAVFLQKEKGYENVKTPPCRDIDFAKAFEKLDELMPIFFSDISKPVISKEVWLRLAAERFDEWLNRDKETPCKNGSNQNLIDFLTTGHGFRYIETYKEFRQLADLVKENGYNAITNPPCEPERFNLAVDEAFELIELHKKCIREYRLNPLDFQPDPFHGVEPKKTVPSLMTLCYFTIFSEGCRADDQKSEIDEESSVALEYVKENLRQMGVLR